MPPPKPSNHMKRAAILHGTDASPDANWFKWLKQQLEQRDYNVWVPELPNNHTPNRKTYNDFLFGSDWDFNDNLLIGHSSGAITVLNLLTDGRCPKISAAVLVGAWSHMEETYLDREQFKDLFPPNGFDFEIIISKCDKFLFLHGDNDPFCPLEQAKWLAQQTKGHMVIIPNGHHLGASRTPDFPELLEGLRKYHVL
jgi:uncharacterized protein